MQIIKDQQKLDDLFEKVKKVDDEEMKSHWSKYLCVLVSGFLENSLRNLMFDYTSRKSHPNIANFVGSQIKGITNPNEEKIKQLLGSFSKDWLDLFEQSISGEHKDAMDSIVANRHLIVHGHSVGITYVRVNDYYKKIKDVIKIIYHICFPA